MDHRPRGLAYWSRPPRRDIGKEPDYRFSFANERTFLAWIRTALAFVAGGLVVIQVLRFPVAAPILGSAFVGLGTLLAAAAYGRWARAEEAMRNDMPLPPSVLPRLVAVGVLVVAVIAIVFFLLAPEGGVSDG